MLRVEVRVKSVKEEKVRYNYGIKYMTMRNGCVDELFRSPQVSGLRGMWMVVTLERTTARAIGYMDCCPEGGQEHHSFCSRTIRAAGSGMHASRL